VGDRVEGRRRRWPYAVGPAVVTVLLATAIVRSWWPPHDRPALHDGERYGVDVSHHQGTTDGERVAGDHLNVMRGQPPPLRR
jgi:lysozyme